MISRVHAFDQKLKVQSESIRDHQTDRAAAHNLQLEALLDILRRLLVQGARHTRQPIHQGARGLGQVPEVGPEDEGEPGPRSEVRQHRGPQEARVLGLATLP